MLGEGLALREGDVVAATLKRARCFLIDERYVALDHNDSNYRALRAGPFASGTAYEDISIEAIRPELPLDECASDYERRFREAASPPRFDLVLMGIGSDGHCASLFPDHPSGEFSIEPGGERSPTSKLVIAVRDSPKPPAERISFTAAVLRSAKRIRVAFRGAAKQSLLRMLSAHPERYPASRILLGHPNAKVYVAPDALPSEYAHD